VRDEEESNIALTPGPSPDGRGEKSTGSSPRKKGRGEFKPLSLWERGWGEGRGGENIALTPAPLLVKKREGSFPLYLIKVPKSDKL